MNVFVPEKDDSKALWEYAFGKEYGVKGHGGGGKKPTDKQLGLWKAELRKEENWRIISTGNEKLVQFQKSNRGAEAWLDWFVVKKSKIDGAGEGLFAARAFPPQRQFAQGKYSNISKNRLFFPIAFYEGVKYDDDSKLATTDYALEFGSNKLDGSQNNFNCTGKINDSRGRYGGWNVKFKQNGAIVATKEVKKGEELYIDYGPEYWNNRKISSKGSKGSISTKARSIAQTKPMASSSAGAGGSSTSTAAPSAGAGASKSSKRKREKVYTWRNYKPNYWKTKRLGGYRQGGMYHQNKQRNVGEYKKMEVIGVADTKELEALLKKVKQMLPNFDLKTFAQENKNKKGINLVVEQYELREGYAPPTKAFNKNGEIRVLRSVLPLGEATRILNDWTDAGRTEEEIRAQRYSDWPQDMSLKEIVWASKVRALYDEAKKYDEDPVFTYDDLNGPRGMNGPRMQQERDMRELLSSSTFDDNVWTKANNDTIKHLKKVLREGNKRKADEPSGSSNARKRKRGGGGSKKAVKKSNKIKKKDERTTEEGDTIATVLNITSEGKLVVRVDYPKMNDDETKTMSVEEFNKDFPKALRDLDNDLSESDEEVSDSDDEGELTYESRDGTKRANILSRKNGLIQFEEYEPNTQDKAQENIETNTRELTPYDFEREFPTRISAEDLLLEAYESEGAIPFTYKQTAAKLFLEKAKGQIYRDRVSEFEFKIKDDPEFEVFNNKKPVKFSKLTLVPRWNRVDQADAELLVTYSNKGGSPCTLPEFLITGYLPTFADFHETFERLADSEQEYLEYMRKAEEEYPLITTQDVQTFNEDWAFLDKKFVNITDLDNVTYGSINRTPDDAVEEEFALVVSEDNSSTVTFKTFKESMAEEDLSASQKMGLEDFLKAYTELVPTKAAEFVTFAKCLENFRDAVRKRGNNVEAVGLELGVFAGNATEPNGKVVYDDTFPFIGDWDDFTEIINLTGTTWREEWNELYKEKDVEVYVAPTGIPEKGDIWEGFMKIFAFVVEVKDSKDRGDIKIRFRKNSRDNAWDMLNDGEKNPPVKSNPIFENEVHEWMLSTFLNQYGKLYKKADEPSGSFSAGSSGSSFVSPVSTVSPPSETPETPNDVIDLVSSSSEDEDSDNEDKVIVHGGGLTDNEESEDEDSDEEFAKMIKEGEEEAGIVKPPSGTSSTSRLVSMLRILKF